MIKVNVAERASERRKEKERNSSDGDAMASEDEDEERLPDDLAALEGMFPEDHRKPLKLDLTGIRSLDAPAQEPMADENLGYFASLGSLVDGSMMDAVKIGGTGAYSIYNAMQDQFNKVDSEQQGPALAEQHHIVHQVNISALEQEARRTKCYISEPVQGHRDLVKVEMKNRLEAGLPIELQPITIVKNDLHQSCTAETPRQDLTDEEVKAVDAIFDLFAQGQDHFTKEMMAVPFNGWGSKHLVFEDIDKQDNGKATKEIFRSYMEKRCAKLSWSPSGMQSWLQKLRQSMRR